MKYHGKEIEGPNVETIVFPRPSGDIVFEARAVLEFEEFEKIMPRPEPPEVLKPGGIRFRNPEDPGYKELLTKWAETQTHWLVLKSLEESPGLEWDTIDMSDPDTWSNYVEELKKAGFTPIEVALLVEKVTTACGFNQDKIEKATKDFLEGRRAAVAESTSQNTEAQSTPSGEPVNDS